MTIHPMDHGSSFLALFIDEPSVRMYGFARYFHVDSLPVVTRTTQLFKFKNESNESNPKFEPKIEAEVGTPMATSCFEEENNIIR